MFMFFAQAVMVLTMTHGDVTDQLVIHGMSGQECIDRKMLVEHHPYFKDDAGTLWRVEQAVCTQEKEA